MTQNLASLLLERTPRGEKTFIEQTDGRRLTYGDLPSATAKFANTLIKLGVQPGDRIAAQIEKSIDAVVLYLACLRCGAIFLPLNTAYTLAELDYFLMDAEPSLLVCDPARASNLQALAAQRGVKHVATLGSDGTGSLVTLAADQPAIFSDFVSGPDDIAAILYTSGTTGRSKGAMLSHANLSSNALTLAAYWKFTETDVLLHALPIFHTHGLFVAINVTLASGASILMFPRFDADELMRLMPRATTLMGVPTFYVRLLQHPALGEATTNHMRLFISGSAPLLTDTHAQWRERTGLAILERYGMTETNMNTSNPYDGARKPGTVGLPLPDIDLRIVDPENGQPVPVGELGMIEIKGPNVFKGYWRNPEKTKADFRTDGYFITGDMGCFDEDGYVQIIGRSKDLIISGGYNIYPKEIETEIDQLPGVSESAVIGVPHPDLGEAAVALIVASRPEDVDILQISETLALRLAKYKHPKRLIVIPDLPRNAMGKVQKNILRDTYRELFLTAPESRE